MQSIYEKKQVTVEVCFGHRWETCNKPWLLRNYRNFELERFKPASVMGGQFHFSKWQ